MISFLPAGTGMRAVIAVGNPAADALVLAAGVAALPAAVAGDATVVPLAALPAAFVAAVVGAAFVAVVVGALVAGLGPSFDPPHAARMLPAAAAAPPALSQRKNDRRVTGVCSGMNFFFPLYPYHVHAPWSNSTPPTANVWCGLHEFPPPVLIDSGQLVSIHHLHVVSHIHAKKA